MDVDEAVSVFYQWVEAAVADHIPTITFKGSFPPWFDAIVKRACVRRSSLIDARSCLQPLRILLIKRSCFKFVTLAKYRAYILH